MAGQAQNQTAGQGQAAQPPPAAPAPLLALPPPSRTLTLDDALADAAARNLDLKAAGARLRQAQQTIWKAWAGYLPQVSASGTYTRNQEGAEIPAGVFGPDAITIVAK